MATDRTRQTIYIGTAKTIESMNDVDLGRPGELGAHVISPSDAKEYQIIKLDSGAVAAAGAGVVAAGQLAFWKNRASYLVTNDKVQAIGGPSLSTSRDAVAGVFTTALTAGRHGAIQLKGRRSVKTDGGGDFVLGDKIVPSINAAADGDRNASGTAPPVTMVGRVAAVEASGFTACDLDLPYTP